MFARSSATVRASLALAAVAAALALCDARTDHDFEFVDSDTLELSKSLRPRPRHLPRRYVYHPQHLLCKALVCRRREVCLLRESYTAVCANKKDVLRRGDLIVSFGSHAATSGGADDEDVFYEEGVSPAPEHEPARADVGRTDSDTDRCVGCGASEGPGASFVCGSDNRTYSSLCRLDLHNCVRRPRAPVRLACAGFCPCAPPAPAAPAAPPAPAAPARDERRRPRPHRLRDSADYDVWRRTAQTARGDHPRSDMELRNEVVQRPQRARRPNKETEGCELDKMANRLLDWFSVLMEEAGGVAPPHGTTFPPECKAEVRWMFRHLDVAGDGTLQDDDLYALSHDERERCLRPFLRSCGAGVGGGGGGVTRAAWCRCLGGAARPCAALARAARGRGGRRGGFVPACDARGWYRPRQCHAALAVCWCVDPRGVELPGSRTKGAPMCPGEERDAAPADDEDEEEGEGGSGDGALDPRF